MKLSEIINKSKGIVDCKFKINDPHIESIEYDSRKIKKGSLFVALTGFNENGHDYIDSAIENGAVAIVVSEDRFNDLNKNFEKDVEIIVSVDTRKALSALSAAFLGHPSKDISVIGITGTNGKTSITFMLESILKRCGISAGVIGTINYRWNGNVIPAENTTPESKDLQEFLYKMKNDGVKVVVIEVSSHALFLHRANDIDFDIAVFTNLTRDHLDFHGSFEEYFNAKKILFDLLENSEKENRAGIVNIDDEYGEIIYKDKEKYTYPILTFGFDDRADFRADTHSIKSVITGLQYTLESPEKGERIELKLPGKFHLYNSLSAIAALSAMKIPFSDIKAGLKELENVPGRFDVVDSGSGFYIVIDYAHTNDALEKLLISARELAEGRLITVFGCGGDRDKTKRPIMGNIALEYSDLAIVTSDNPRTEDPDEIINDIICGSKDSFKIIPDREEAIKWAISNGAGGDLIVIAGKGHEDYQIIGKTKIHFDDREVAIKYINERKAG